MPKEDQLMARMAQARAALRKTFDIHRFCFNKQLAFIEDPAPFKVAVCSRRAGKTVACAAHLVHTAISKPAQVCLYITLSRLNAKKIIWRDLLEINRVYSLGAIINETELSLRFPNDSVIYLSGAKDKTEIEKFRGLAITLCYIDECQSFRSYIQELVDDVIAKALFDYNGTLCLIGTPGPVPAGYFYDCSTSLEWSHHGWTFFDNPWIERKSGKTHQALLERELKRKGVTVDDPGIQREVFGKWTVDYNSLVFRYSAEKNHYSQLPSVGGQWRYIFGVDLGFDDSDAIAVIAYNEKLPMAFLTEELVTPKQGITELSTQIQRLIDKYNPDSIVMDTGGLGKKIAEEMSKRYGIGIKAAEKVRKFEFIEILNDAMRTERFFANKNGRFAQDCMLVEWDKDSTQLKINDRYHSDICDAVLYAFRESLHWLHIPAEPIVLAGTDEWYAKQAEQMEQEALNAMERSKQVDDHFLFGEGLSRDADWD